MKKALKVDMNGNMNAFSIKFLRGKSEIVEWDYLEIDGSGSLY